MYICNLKKIQWIQIVFSQMTWLNLSPMSQTQRNYEVLVVQKSNHANRTIIIKDSWLY